MKYLQWFVAVAAPMLAVGFAAAQPPQRERPAQQGDLVTRMMAFDKNKDGKLAKDEITDPRLMRLFEQADVNKDGTVTKEELEVVAKKLATDDRGGPGGPGGGPGGPGGQGGRGRGGPGMGGMGGRFGPPAPGTILPTPVQDQLRLTDEQKKQLDALQNEVNAKLEKILTEEQKKQMKEMQNRGPGGFPGGPGGGPGGPGRGPGGPGGPGGGPDR